MVLANLDKNTPSERIISLVKMDGKHTIASSGLVDNRLFTGENKLIAKQDEASLWYLQYAHGNLEEPLREKFTTFTQLMKRVREHFKKRNIIAKEHV